MKIGFKIAIVAFLIGLFSCKKRCPNPDYYAFPTQTEEYFGVFRAGNWWVYETSNSSKKDSVFISAYQDTRFVDGDICVGGDARKMTLNSKYLPSYDSTLSVIYSFFSPCCNWYFKLDGRRTHHEIQFNSDGQFRIDGDTSQSRFKQIVIDTTTFKRVIYSHSQPHYDPELFFAPKVGIIKYIIGRDTFLLKKYKI